MINLNTSSEVNRTALQEINLVPSKEQAHKTFWSLGNEFWMQIIDGKYHQHGPMVFDDSLHQGFKEPGFFNSLKNGCEFASQHLTEKLSMQFYKDLHKILCSHFKGKENNTNMHADETGSFRDDFAVCKIDLEVLNDEARENYLIMQLYKMCFEENAPDEEYSSTLGVYIKKYQKFHTCAPEWVEKKLHYWKNQTGISETLQKEYQKSKILVEEYQKIWGSKINELNSNLSNVCHTMSIDNIASFRIINNTTLYVDYAKLGPEKHDQIVQVLFDNYNNKINKINSNAQKSHLKTQSVNEKIEAIANLFQMLEWLHPFQDGQGRTDLVLQAKLLCEVGANPAILNEPFISTYSLLPEWKEYLLSGIENWKAKV